MTVKDVLKISAEQLCEQDALAIINDKAPENIEYANQTLKLLKQCYDLISDELACEFYPLKTSEEFVVTDNKIPYSAFSKTPLRILSVTDDKNNKCPYKLVNDYLSLENGKRKVKYEYRPQIQDESENALFVDGKIGVFVMCFGINAEFCFARGRYGESEKWREKFLSGIKNRIANKSCIKLLPRRWI